MTPPKFDRSVSAEQEIQHGLCYVVKWKNPAINRLDWWIGVHIPDALAIRFKERPSNPDKPAEPKYQMWLPGRNMRYK